METRFCDLRICLICENIFFPNYVMNMYIGELPNIEYTTLAATRRALLASLEYVLDNECCIVYCSELLF